MDLGIEVILELFTSARLEELFDLAYEMETIKSPNAQRIYSLADDYLNTISAVINFLQGKQPTLARLICGGGYLPQAARFDQLEDMEWAFGNMGMQDKANVARMLLMNCTPICKKRLHL